MIDIFKILICDDQALIRESLAIILEKQEDLKVVGEASNGKEAVEMAGTLEPDLILMDMRMPVMDGIEATKAIHQKHPQIKVVALTTFEEDDLISTSLANGAVGYLLKDITTSDLVKAIQLIREGTSILPTSFTQKLVGMKGKRVSKRSFGLTDREFEVLQCLFEGMGNREMAEKLFISETTVKNHLTNIFAKLEVKNRTQAVSLAMENDLIERG